MAASMAVPLSRMTSAPIFEQTSDSEATAPWKPIFFWGDELDEFDDRVSTTAHATSTIAMTTTTKTAKVITLINFFDAIFLLICPWKLIKQDQKLERSK